MKSFPLHRLQEFVRLERSETEAFLGLAVDRLHFKRHDLIRNQGSATDHVYFLIEGWVACQFDTADGGQQIVKVHMPGDVLGGASLALTHAAESLVALNPTIVDVIPSQRLGELFMSSPRLAAAMYFVVQQERVWLMDKITSIGRTSAAQRLATFLLSVHDRLRKIDGRAGRTFELPLSQAELANVLGITTVHTNRTIQQLERTGMISRSGRQTTLEDLKALRAFSAVPHRKFRSVPAWLGEED